MEIEEYVLQARDLVNASPIKAEFPELDKIREQLDILYEKCQNPLRVVLMGAVKSGKSTLLNALAGSRVSPVGVAETTAVIIRVGYAPMESAEIIFGDGTKQGGTPAEIFQQLETHRGDAAYFSQCEEVCIHMPLSGLRTLEIVDTPGVATLTATNEQRAHDYIQRADVILWILHGGYLGQSTVNEELEQVCQYGKPVIAVISHIDNMEQDAEEAVEYIEEEMVENFRAVFAFSGKRAMEAIKKQDEKELQASGYCALLSYLKENIDKNSNVVQADSLLDSVKVQLRKEKMIHDAEIQSWRKEAAAFRDCMTALATEKDRICKYFTNRLRMWVEQEFLTKEYDEFSDYLGTLSWPLNTAKAEEIQEKEEQIFSDRKIRVSVEHFLSVLEKDFQAEWQQALSDIRAAMIENYGQTDFDHVVAEFSMDGNRQPADFSGTLNTVGKTTAATALVGTGISAYAAGLGTYAAHLSMAGAMGSFMPPALLIGAALGAVWNWRNYGKKLDELRQGLLADTQRTRQNFLVTTLPKFTLQIERLSNCIIRDVRQAMEQEKFQMEDTEAAQYIQALEEHCHQTELLMADAPAYQDVLSDVRNQMQKTIAEQEKRLKTAKADYSDDSRERMQKIIARLQEENQQLEKKFDVEIQNYQRKLQRAGSLSAEEQEHLQEQIKRINQEKKTLQNRLHTVEVQAKAVQKENEQMRVDLAQQEKKLQEWRENIRKQLQQALPDGTAIEDAMDLEDASWWEKMIEIFRPVADKMKLDDMAGFAAIQEKNQQRYRSFDEKTIDFLSTGDFLYCRLSSLRGINLDISTAILEYCKAVERIMRQLLSMGDCQLYEICKRVECEHGWKPQFANKLHQIRKCRNQIAHVDTIDPQNVTKVRGILFDEEYDNQPGYEMLNYLHDRCRNRL